MREFVAAPLLTAVTIDAVMSWSPCYGREEIEALAGDRHSMTPLEIADLDVPVEDRLWLLLRPEILPEAVLHTLACDFAEHALQREREAGREPDARCWAAIGVKRRWIGGEATDEELTAARNAASAASAAAWNAASAAARDASAARDAARDAASAAAWYAARDARAAARAAAWYAARNARAAASAAAWYAARDAEREWQLERVKVAFRKLQEEVARCASSWAGLSCRWTRR